MPEIMSEEGIDGYFNFCSEIWNTPIFSWQYKALLQKDMYAEYATTNTLLAFSICAFHIPLAP